MHERLCEMYPPFRQRQNRFEQGIRRSGASDGMNDFAGIYRGVVTNVHDPHELCRVQVRIPAVSGNTEIWAAVLAHGSRPFIPAVDSEVIVAFEGGDPTSPFVLGRLWHQATTSPESHGGT